MHLKKVRYLHISAPPTSVDLQCSVRWRRACFGNQPILQVQFISSAHYKLSNEYTGHYFYSIRRNKTG